MEEGRYIENYDNMDKRDIFSTKEYYEYYNSFKPRDSRLEKPTYIPQTDVNLFKQFQKASD
jgi:hypothetical protein